MYCYSICQAKPMICQAKPIRPLRKIRWVLVLVGHNWRYWGYNWEMEEIIRKDSVLKNIPRHCSCICLPRAKDLSILSVVLGSVLLSKLDGVMLTWNDIEWTLKEWWIVVVVQIVMNNAHRIIVDIDRRGRLDDPLVVMDQWQHGWPNLEIILRIGEAMEVFRSVYCWLWNPNLGKQ